MAKSLNVCLEESIGTESVGESVTLVLKSDYVGLATCGGIIRGEITFFQKLQGRLSKKTVKAWDACKHLWVNNTTFDYNYSYCYTIEYNDAETSPPGQAILPEQVEEYIWLDTVGKLLANTTLQQNAGGDILFKSPLCSKLTAKILSTAAGNVLIVGSDKGLYLNGAMIAAASLAAINFAVVANSGPSQTIVNNNTLSILGGDAITTVASNTDRVTISVVLSPNVGNILQIVSGRLYATLPGAGGTDILVIKDVNPVGSQRFRHTSLNGTNVEFHAGFSHVTSNTGCGSGNKGIGSNKMVKSLAIVNNSLVMEAAPEHTHIVAGTTFAAAFIEDISVAPITRNHGPTPVIVVNNLNSCRQINGRWHIDSVMQGEFYPVGVWRYRLQIDIGAGAVNVGDSQYGSFPALTGLPMKSHATGIVGISPGGNMSITAAHQVTTLVNSSGGVSRVVSAAINCGFSGGTA